MAALAETLQLTATERLLGDAGVAAIAAESAGGPAVFAERQAYPDVFPRITVEAVQVVPRATSCGRPAAAYLTLHSWAIGPDATLVAGRLADAAEAALRAPLTLDGHRVSTHAFEGARPVGDPDPAVEHVVSTFRFNTTPTP